MSAPEGEISGYFGEILDHNNSNNSNYYKNNNISSASYNTKVNKLANGNINNYP